MAPHGKTIMDESPSSDHKSVNPTLEAATWRSDLGRVQDKAVAAFDVWVRAEAPELQREASTFRICPPRREGCGMSDYDVSGIQIIPQGDTLYAFIEQIRKKPALFCGEESITALHNVINGYIHACQNHGIEERQTQHWGGFHEFVRARTGFRESTSGWCSMLLSVNRHDEAKALAAFFLLFEAFSSRANGPGT
jgi:hypothetical protein